MSSWFLVLQLLLPFALPSTELRYAYRPDARVSGRIDVIVTYPLGRISEVCTLMQQESDGATVSEHCWTPTNPISDIDHWDEWDMEGLFVVVKATVTDEKGTHTEWAWPIELENDDHGIVEVK